MIPVKVRSTIIAGLVGQPYQEVSRHCWWLAGLVQRSIFGRALPGWEGMLPASADRTRIFRDHPARSDWHAHPEPVDGDLVLMGRAPGQEIHCGVYLGDHAKVIHTDVGHGVVLDTVTELRAAYGWRHLTFNRPAR